MVWIMNMRCQQNALVEAAALENETLLFHPQANKFYVLNSTSSFIWSHLQEPCTVQQIAEEINRNFQDVTEQGTIRDVENTIQDMLTLGLIVSVG
jgi:Coenzyme PQQ synthesis protein D (PqqD)